ncbi:peptidoglycan DD-metalloendopeptidase family protein [Terrilactibacillus sp. BCM23-1]|uniref:Peptidoglycan DD-metalloendopeptidase family protein n=1 Tax=Terrilactibacillus tamarindi TaxID=2599694 RepID=A0A6N8CM45_9BACI|nr:M23 family metallopeptidase [Terrilactibacillus tamarindi]MTT30668.1 peptidoglycan DD-metalloendopeptidase family protein [Terrilactibacillus tamarindi]
MSYLYRTLFLSLLLFCLSTPLVDKNSLAKQSIFDERKALYLKTAAVTGVPWTILAACDQYERNIHRLRTTTNTNEDLIGIKMDEHLWVGLLNPNPKDTNPKSIAFFQGQGKDGNGDGIIDIHSPEDVLYSYASILSLGGPGLDNEKIALWKMYHRGKTVEMITEYAKLYQHFNTTQLEDHAFPVPVHMNYDYQSTWGARRGWGGLRIHEGTDIFADYGTPVLATSYGVIEMMGWNKYGGWRVGLRDPQNNYHYFGHLRGYANNIHEGSVIKPGQVIGYVGSSGYGPEGTQGKFPPHLHYGMYRDNGRTEFSFDPYPYLRTWETKSLQQHK